MKLSKFQIRVTVLAFFIGLNIILGTYFIKHNTFHLPKELLTLLTKLHLLSPSKLEMLEQKIILSGIDDGETQELESLDPQVILEKLNEERSLIDVGELSYNEQLASIAGILLTKAQRYDFEVESDIFSQQLKSALKIVGYDYEHVSHNMLLGPATEQAVVDAWYSSDEQIKAIQDDDFTEVGFATKVLELKDLGRVGVTIQVLGKPMTKRVEKKYVSPIFPSISDQEVFEALNEYRKDHGVRELKIDGHLCKYAEKRVGDLVKYGGLDEHAGFKEDFKDQDNLPDPIQAYSGHSIAENLAHQYCKNMTTGDSFIAQTGTAIIEWCFDSSTKGHREAQLNPDFRNVCVRHDSNMYVVIFGD